MLTQLMAYKPINCTALHDPLTDQSLLQDLLLFDNACSGVEYRQYHTNL